MVVDYSRNISKFTLLHPLPNLNELVNNIAGFKVYSTSDLRSAYHQVSIREGDKPYTAFEACHRLYQFRRIPFGVTNGGAAFQLTDEHSLTGLFAYLENITVCGNDQSYHGTNVSRLLEIVNDLGFTLNGDTTIASVNSINILGFSISNGTIKPDPERMQPLLDLPVPHNPQSLKRALGLFSIYSQWVPRFSDRILSLTCNPSFPMAMDAVKAFNDLKLCIADPCVIYPNGPTYLYLSHMLPILCFSQS